MRGVQQVSKIFDKAVADGVELIPSVTSDFMVQTVMISTSGSAQADIKVRATVRDDVDLTQANSDDNPWFYVRLVNLTAGADIDGKTGVQFTGTDDTVGVEPNINYARQMAVEIDNWVAGNISVDVVCAEDN